MDYWWKGLCVLICLTPCYVYSASLTNRDAVERGGSDAVQKYWVEVTEADSKFSQFFNKSDGLWVGVGAGSLVVLLITLAILIISICYCYRRHVCCFRNRLFIPEKRPLISNRPPHDALYSNGGLGRVEVSSRGRGKGRHERTVAEELRRQKEQQEQMDRDNAKYIVEFYLRNDKRYIMTDYLPDMGSRMLKFWFKVRSCKDGKEHLLTVAPVSNKCPLTLDTTTMKTMNKLLSMLSHPHLHPIYEIIHIEDRRQVLIIQPITGGSLKDTIYKSTPTTEWTMKYSRRCRGLPPKRVALYGRQILEALRYLYGHGFPSLGHIQTGNIFVEGDICRLGGFENTLLFYKTRSYKLCKGNLESIDLILFGHVIFEMCCGYELTSPFPKEQDYKSVKDARVQDVLQVIFEMDEKGDFVSSIDKVYHHPFFRDVDLPIQEGARSDHTHFPGDVRNLLAKVAKSKPREQNTSSNHERKKRKSGGQQHGPVKSEGKSSGVISASSQAQPTTSVTVKRSVATDAGLSSTRSAVLDSIRGNRLQLRKTKTDDRSAPRLEY